MKKLQTKTHKLLNRQTRRARLSLFLAIGFFAFFALAIAVADGASILSRLFSVQAAQSKVSGEWTAELNRKKTGEIQMTFHRRSEKGGFNMTSDSVAVGELQGLTAENVAAPKADVSFNIVREAGTFACEGIFREGRGAGFWSFASNPTFVSAMRGRGYDNLTDEYLLRAALHNLTTKYIEDLKSAGYERLEFNQLLRAASHEITPKFISEMKSAGFENLTMEQLIRAQNHGINSEFIKEVEKMGFDKQPLETLIRLRNHNITQEFINQMRSAGFENLSIEQLIRLKNHSITAEFVNDLKAEGFTNISAETAIRLKNHEIDRDFIRRVKAKGFTDVTLDQLIKLRSQDIIK